METQLKNLATDMQPNEELIQRFFHCFAGGDYRGMQQCLHPDVEFSDIGFQLRGKQVAAMWHMICAKGTQIMFRDIKGTDSEGSAHWECHYDFQKGEHSGPRSVHNIIEAKFRFQNGLIREHHDSCDFGRWAGQALGIAGSLLAWTDFLHNKVRKSAKAKIEAFIAQHPEYV
ncbi:MAG: nuclear transport factor 2 family protein [Planctomycetaceae bacterium]